MSLEISSSFPKYTNFDSAVPVWCVTPGTGRLIHRFFDTSPFSPSGRYLALTRLPYEDRLPQPGDAAEVVLVDLREGEERVVAETRGWDSQLGAQVQWGGDDAQLFFNDMDLEAWRPYGVVVDPESGARRDLEGTVYMVSSDGSRVASPCLLRTGATQAGYGVVAPPEHVPANRGASADDGVFVIHVESGRCSMVISLKEIVEETGPPLAGPDYSEGDFYAAHVKWNPQGDRLMLVLRWQPWERGKMKRDLITMRADGSDVRVTVPEAEWGKGGHHPNWCPDGETVLMNLKLDGKGMRFVTVGTDGKGLKAIGDGIVGSGHPTLHPDGRHILTDAYPHESVAYGDGSSPIRLVDASANQEMSLARINVLPEFRGPMGELRVDPHPAWDTSFQYAAFNGYADGTRRVYVADLREVLR